MTRDGRTATGHGEADKEGSIYAPARRRAVAAAIDAALADAAAPAGAPVDTRLGVRRGAAWSARKYDPRVPRRRFRAWNRTLRRAKAPLAGRASAPLAAHRHRFNASKRPRDRPRAPLRPPQAGPVRARTPPTLAYAPLPTCTWDERRGAFVGKDEDGTTLVLADLPTSPAPEVLARLVEPSSVEALAARFSCETLVVASERACVWLHDGGVFAGHAIEVVLDAEGAVMSASLAG